MTIVQINTSCGIGSIGKICVAVSKLLYSQGIENYILYSHETNGYQYGIYYGLGKPYFKAQALKSRIIGNNGFNSHLTTLNLIKKLDEINPDIVHLHNLHSHAVNLEMLFTYLRKKEIKILWTFHDCWAFTAYCTYFDLLGCFQWKKECHKCMQLRGNSWFFDRSKVIYNKKMLAVQNLNLKIITPSKWLAGLVGESFFSDYPIEIVPNGIDLTIFKPTKSRFREKYKLIGKKIVLGIAFNWDERKGLNDFIILSKLLEINFSIVLVGVSKAQCAELPSNVIGIERTSSQKELAEIYTAADVFVNTTYEDNYPTVNLEARACGTPVITYNTGGSPESAGEDAFVVECGNIPALKEAIEKMTNLNLMPSLNETDISQENTFGKYIDIYAQY